MKWNELAEFIRQMSAAEQEEQVRVESDPVESGEPPFPPQFATVAIPKGFGGYTYSVLFVLPKGK